MNGIILNTRPALHQERFHEAFAMAGWRIVDCPVLTPMPVAASIPPAHSFTMLIFTSRIAVLMFPASGGWLKKKVLAVGPATAEAARAAGFPNVQQTGFDIDDLRQYLVATTFGTALYPSAADVTADLAEEFPHMVQRIITYKTVPVGVLPDEVVAAAKDGAPILAPLFSRRSAAVLADLLGKAGLGGINATRILAVGISADVFAQEDGPWQRRAIAREPTLDGVATKARELAEEMTGQGSAIQ